MIILRPTYSLLIYILCYNYVRAQCISSCYDGWVGPVYEKSTNLCRWPYTFVPTLGQPSDSCSTTPIVCQSSTDQSRWPCTIVPTFDQSSHPACLGPVLRTEVPCESAGPKIYLVGCGRDVYEIIEEIKNKGMKVGLQIHFYLFQNGRYKFLGNFITTYEILKSVLRRRNIYYCTSREYVNQHNDSDVCMYDGTVIMIPESSESKALVDTGAWNLVEDKIRENPDYKNDGVVNIWNLVKKDNKQGYYGVSAPTQNENVCAPVNIDFKNAPSYNSATLCTKIAKDYSTGADENTKYSNTYNLDNRNYPYYYTAKQTNYVCQPYHQTSNPVGNKYLPLPNLYSRYLTANSQTSKPQILSVGYATTRPEGYSIQTQQQQSDNNYVTCTRVNTVQYPTASISNYAINTNPQNINQYYIVSKPTTVHPVASSNVLSNLEYTSYDTTKPCYQYALPSPPNVLSQNDYSKPTKSAYLNQFISKITPINMSTCSEVKYSLEPYKPKIKSYDKINVAAVENITPLAVTASNMYATTTKVPANYRDITYGKQIAVPYSPICKLMSLGNSYSRLGKQYVASPSIISNTLQPLVNELKYDSNHPKLPCYINKWPSYSYNNYFKKPQFETELEPSIRRHQSDILANPYQEPNYYNFVSPSLYATQEMLPGKGNVFLYNKNPCAVQSTKYTALRTPKTSSLIVPFIPTAAISLPSQILQGKSFKEPCKHLQEYYPEVSKGYLSELPKKSYVVPFGAQYSEISNDKMLPLPFSTATAFAPSNIYTRPKDYLLYESSFPICSNLAQSTKSALIASPTTLSEPYPLARTEIMKPIELSLQPIKYTEQSFTQKYNKVSFGTAQTAPCSYASTTQSYVQSSMPALPFYSPFSPTCVFTKPQEYLPQVEPPCSLVTQDASHNNNNLAYTEILKPTQPIKYTEQSKLSNYDKSPLESIETTPCPYAFTSKPTIYSSNTTLPIFSPLRPTCVYTNSKAYSAQSPSYICSNLVQPSNYAQVSSPLALYKPNSCSLAQILKPTKYTTKPLSEAKSYPSAYYKSSLAATQMAPYSRASISESYIQPSIAELPQYTTLSKTSIYTKPRQYFSQLPSYVCRDVAKPKYFVTQPCTYSLSPKEVVNPTDYTWNPKKYTELGATPSPSYIDESLSYSLPAKTGSPYYLSSHPTSIFTKPKEYISQQLSYICGEMIEPSKFITPAVTSLFPQVYPEKYFEAPLEATPKSDIQTSIPALSLYSPFRPTTVYTKPKEYLAQAPLYISDSVAQPYNFVTQPASSFTISKPNEYKTGPLKYEAKSYPQRYNIASLEPTQITQYSYASTPQSYISSSILAVPHYSPLLPTNLYTNLKEYISQLPPYICNNLAQPAGSSQTAQTENLKPDSYTARAMQHADDTYSKSPFLAPFRTRPVTYSDVSYKPTSPSYFLPCKTALPQYSPLHSTSIYTKPKAYLSQAPSDKYRNVIQPSSFITYAAAPVTVSHPNYNLAKTVNIKPSEYTALPIKYKTKSIPQKNYESPLVTQTAPCSYASAIQSSKPTQRFSPLHVTNAYTNPREYLLKAPSYISGSVTQPCSFVTQAASPIAVSKPNTYSWTQTEISKPTEYITKPLKYTEQSNSQKYYETPSEVTHLTPLSYASLTPQSYLQPVLPQYTPLYPTRLYTNPKEYISQYPSYICSDVAKPSYFITKPTPLSTLPNNDGLARTENINPIEYTTQPMKYLQQLKPEKYYKIPSVATHPVSNFETPSYSVLPQNYLSPFSPLTVPTLYSQEYLLSRPTTVYPSTKNYYAEFEDVVKLIDPPPLENIGPKKHILHPEKYVDYTDCILPQTRKEATYETVQRIPDLENVKFSFSPYTYSLPSVPYSLQPSVYTRPKEYYSQPSSNICKDIGITSDRSQLPVAFSQPCTNGLKLIENIRPTDYTIQSFPKKYYAVPFGITTKAPRSEISQYSVAPASYLSPIISSPAFSSQFYSPLRPTSVYTRPKNYVSYPSNYICVNAPKTTDNVFTLPNVQRRPNCKYKLTPKAQSLMSTPCSEISCLNILPKPCIQAAARDIAVSKTPKYTILPKTQPSIHPQAFTPLINEKPTYSSTLLVSKPIEYTPEQPLKYMDTFVSQKPPSSIKLAPYTEVPSYTTSPISYQMPSKPCSVYNTKQTILRAAKVSPVSYYPKYTSVNYVSNIPTTICNQPHQYLSQFPSYISNLPIPKPTTQVSNLIYSSKPSLEAAPTTSSYSTQPVEYLAPSEFSTPSNTIDFYQTPVKYAKMPCKNYPLKSENVIIEPPKIPQITNPCISYDSLVKYLNQPQQYLNKYVPQMFNPNEFSSLFSLPFVSPTTSYVTPSSYSNVNPSYQKPLEYLSKSIKPCVSQSTIPQAMSVKPIVPHYLPQIPYNPYQTSVSLNTVYPSEKYITSSNLPTIQQYISTSPNISLPQIIKPCSKYLMPYHEISQTPNTVTTPLSRYQMPSKENDLPSENLHVDLVQPSSEYSQVFSPTSSIEYAAPLYTHVPQIPKICWPVQPVLQALNQHQPVYATPDPFLLTNSEYSKYIPHGVTTSQTPLSMSSYEYLPSQTLKLYSSPLSIDKTQKPCKYWAQPFGYMPEYSQLSKTILPSIALTKLYTPSIPVCSTSYPKMVYSSKPCQAQSTFTTKDTPLVPTILLNKYPDYKQPIVSYSNKIYTNPKYLLKPQPCSVEYVIQIPKSVPKSVTSYPIVSSPAYSIEPCVSQTPYYQPTPTKSRPLKYTKSSLTGEYVPKIFTTVTAMPLTPIQSERSSSPGLPTTPCGIYYIPQEYSPLPQTYTSNNLPKDPQSKILDTTAQTFSPTYLYENPISPPLYPCDKTIIPVTTLKYVPQVNWLTATPQPCVNNPSRSSSWLTKPLTTSHPASLPVLSTRPSNIYNFPIIPQTPALPPITYAPVQILPASFVSSSGLPVYPCTTPAEYLPQPATYIPKTPTYVYSTSSQKRFPYSSVSVDTRPLQSYKSYSGPCLPVTPTKSAVTYLSPDYDNVLPLTTNTIEYPYIPEYSNRYTPCTQMTSSMPTYSKAIIPVKYYNKPSARPQICSYVPNVSPIYNIPTTQSISTPLSLSAAAPLTTSTYFAQPIMKQICPLHTTPSYQRPTTYVCQTSPKTFETLLSPTLVPYPTTPISIDSKFSIKPLYDTTQLSEYNNIVDSAPYPTNYVEHPKPVLPLVIPTSYEQTSSPVTYTSFRNIPALSLRKQPCSTLPKADTNTPSSFSYIKPISPKVETITYQQPCTYEKPTYSEQEILPTLYTPTIAALTYNTPKNLISTGTSTYRPEIPCSVHKNIDDYKTSLANKKVNPHYTQEAISNQSPTYNTHTRLPITKQSYQNNVDTSSSLTLPCIYGDNIPISSKLSIPKPCYKDIYSHKELPSAGLIQPTEYYPQLAQYPENMKPLYSLSRNVVRELLPTNSALTLDLRILPQLAPIYPQVNAPYQILKDNVVPCEISNTYQYLTTSYVDPCSMKPKYETSHSPISTPSTQYYAAPLRDSILPRAKYYEIPSYSQTISDTLKYGKPTQLSSMQYPTTSYNVPCSPKPKQESPISTPSSQYYNTPLQNPWIPRAKYYKIPSYSQTISDTLKYKKPTQLSPVQYPTTSYNVPCSPKPKQESPISTPSSQYYNTPLQNPWIPRAKYYEIPSYSQTISDTLKYEKSTQLSPVQYPTTSYNVPCSPKPKQESPISTPSSQYYNAPLQNPWIPRAKYYEIPSYSQTISDTLKYEKSTQLSPVQYPTTSYNVPCSLKPKQESPISTPSSQYYNAPLQNPWIPRAKYYEIPSYSQTISDTLKYKKPTQLSPVQYPTTSYNVPCSPKPKQESPISTPSSQYYNTPLQNPWIPRAKYYEIPSYSQIKSDTLKYEKPTQLGPILYPTASYVQPCSPKYKYKKVFSPISIPSTKYYTAPLDGPSIPRGKYNKIPINSQIPSDTSKNENPSQLGLVQYPAISCNVPCSPKPKYETSSSCISTPSAKYFTAPLQYSSVSNGKYFELPLYSQRTSDTLKYEKPSQYSPAVSYNIPCSPKSVYEISSSPIRAPSTQYYNAPLQDQLASKYYKIPSNLHIESNTLKFEQPTQYGPIQYPTASYVQPCSPKPSYEISYSPLNTPTRQYYTTPILGPLAPKTKHYEIPSYSQMTTDIWKIENPTQFSVKHVAPSYVEPCLSIPKYETSYSPLNTPTVQYYTASLLSPLSPKTKHYQIPSYPQMKLDTSKYGSLTAYYGTDSYQPKTDYDTRKPLELNRLTWPCVKQYPYYGQLKPTESSPQIIPFSISPKPDIISLSPIQKTSAYAKGDICNKPYYASPSDQTSEKSEAISKVPYQEFSLLETENVELLDSTPSHYSSGRKDFEPCNKYGLHNSRLPSSITPKANLNRPSIIPDRSTKSFRAQPTIKKWLYFQEPSHDTYYSNQIPCRKANVFQHKHPVVPETGYNSQGPVQLFKIQSLSSPFSPISTNEGTKLSPCYRPLEKYVESPVYNIVKSTQPCLASYAPSLPVTQISSPVDPDSLYVQTVSDAYSPKVAQPETVSISPKQIPTYNVLERSPKFNVPCHKPAYSTNLGTYALTRNKIPLQITNPCTQYDNYDEFKQNQEPPVSFYSSVPSIIQKAKSETSSSHTSYINLKTPQDNILQNVLAPSSSKSTYQSVANYEILKPIIINSGFTPTLPLYKTIPSSPWNSKTTYPTETAIQVPFKLNPCQMPLPLNFKAAYMQPLQALDNKYQLFEKGKPCWPWYFAKSKHLSPSGTTLPSSLGCTTELPSTEPTSIKPEWISYESNQIAQPQYNVINALPITASSYLQPCQQGLIAPGSQYSENKFKVFTNQDILKPTYLSTSEISPDTFSSYEPYYYTSPKTYTMPSHQEIQKPINVIPCTLAKSPYADNQPRYQVNEANLKPFHNINHALKSQEIPSTGPVSTLPSSISEPQIKQKSIDVAPISNEFTEYINEPTLLNPQSREVTSASAKTQPPLYESLVSWPYSKQCFATLPQDIPPVQRTDLYTIDATKPTLAQYSPIQKISSIPYSSLQPYICPEPGMIKTQPTSWYNDAITVPRALPYEITSPCLNTYKSTTTPTITNQIKPFSWSFLKSLPESLVTGTTLEFPQIPNLHQTHATLPVYTKYVDATIANANKDDDIRNEGTPCIGKYEKYIPSKIDLLQSAPYSELKEYPTRAYKTIKTELSSSYENLAKPCYETEFASVQPTTSLEISHSLPTYVSPISSKPKGYILGSKLSMAPCVSHPQDTIADQSQIQYGTFKALPTAKDTVFKEPCHIKYDAIEPLTYAPTSVTPQMLTTYSDTLVPRNLHSGSTQLPCIAPEPVVNQIEILANEPCQKALPIQYYSVQPSAPLPTSKPIETSYTNDLYQESPTLDTQYLENNRYEILANQPRQNPLYAKSDTMKPLAYSLKTKIIKPCSNVKISQSPTWGQYEKIPLEKSKRTWYSNYNPMVSLTYQTSPKYQDAVPTVNIPNIVDGNIFETSPQYASTTLPNASVQIQKPIVSVAPCYKPFICWPCKSVPLSEYKTPLLYAPYECLDSTKSVPSNNKASYIETTPDINSNNLVTSSNLPCEILKLDPTANIGKATLKSTPAQYYPWGSNFWWNNYYYGRNYDYLCLQNDLASTNPTIVTKRPCYNLPYAYDNNYKTADTYDTRLESNWLRPYVRQLAANIQQCHIENLKDKVLNNQQVSIDLGTTTIAQCVPDSCESVSEIKTSDPNINVKTWRSKVKLLKARLVIDTEDRWVTNFVPIVKACYTSDKVANVAKNDITTKFGDTIVVNGYVGMYKPVVFLCNDDYLKLMSGCSNILWMNYDIARYWEIYNWCCNPNVYKPNIYFCRSC